MVKIYKQPFAHDGDTIAIPDASQPDGKMSSTDGWTPDYQLPKTDPNYKPVGRQEMNGVFKEVTEALGQLQLQGAPSFSVDAQPYVTNSVVRHDNVVWISTTDNNNSEPGDDNNWRQAFVIPTGQNIAVFDTAGVTNWDVPSALQSGLLKAHVTVVGGGGGGETGGGQRGAGGGAGGSSSSVLDLTGAASVSITVGSGGSSDVSGGASSFGAFCSATGGAPGAGDGAGGFGGVGSGGDINSGGTDGSDSTAAGGASGGGASIFSGAGRGASSAGRSATGYGSGGGGGITGGTGANGVVIIRW